MLKLKGISYYGKRKTGGGGRGGINFFEEKAVTFSYCCDHVIRLLIYASDSSAVIAWYHIMIAQYSGGSGSVQSGKLCHYKMLWE